jgi:hypothetical protein
MNHVVDISVEAARHAVLRRLAAAIRHGIVGQLQPIALISDALERRARGAAPDMAGLQTGLAQVKTLSRSAMLSCSNLITWIAPEDNSIIPLGEGVDECVKLLVTEFSMRGFNLENHARQIDVGVSHSALRFVLTGSLLAATDAARSPSDLLVAAKVSVDQAVLSIFVRSADRVPAAAASDAYRRLGWSDAEALADAEAVKLSRQSNNITLNFPIRSR